MAALPALLGRASVAAVAVGLLACTPVKVPVPPGVLTVSQEPQATWIRNFNPLLPHGLARWPTRNGIYEPLMIWNPLQGERVPWLATDARWVDGTQALALTLREGVRWSDGAAFDAEDVVFTFTLMQETAGFDASGVWQILEGVEAVDAHTVRFTFQRPYAPGIDRIVGQVIVPQHLWSLEEDPTSWANPEPVGTGPFTEVLRFGGQTWELGRNPHYWQEGRPAVTSLRFPAFPTNEQATLALMDGEVDWAGAFVPAIDRIFVGRDPEHHEWWFPAVGGAIHLYPNNTVPPLDQADVRKAISLALDRALICKVAMYGYTNPADATGLSGGYAVWKSDSAVQRGSWTDHDPARAAAMLDAAGWGLDDRGRRVDPQGTPLALTVTTVSGWSDWVRASQIIARSLQELGIDASVKTHDFGAWMQKMQRGDFELALGWGQAGSTPHPVYRGLLSAETAMPIGEPGQTNWHRHESEEADALLEAFETNADPQDQHRAITALQDLMVERAPALPLFWAPSWGEANTSRFTGFPSPRDPYARLSPNTGAEALLVLTRLEPR